MATTNDILIPRLTFEEASAPGTPPAGQIYVYGKADGKMYRKDDAGAEAELGGTSGGGITRGSAFPGSPSTGALYQRSDIDELIFVYDGTRWVTQQMFTASVNDSGSSLSANFARWMAPFFSTLDIFVERLTVSALVNVTNNGSNYWTFKLQKASDLAYADVGSGVSTSASAADTWVDYNEDIGVVVAAATGDVIRFNGAKNGSPDAVFVAATMFYRLIAA